MSSLERRIAVIIALVLVLIYLTRLDRPGLLAPGEGRYAEAARAMVLTGDWIVPRVNGQIHLENPPLLYWLTAVSFSLFGASEANARIIPVLCSLLAGLVVFLLGRRIYGETGGWLAGFILLTGMTWSIYGRFLTSDIPAIAFQAVALWAFWRAWETGENGARRYLLVFSVALAASILTRGLLALVFPLITIFVFVLIRREWRPRDPVGWIWALCLLFVLVVPWHVAVEIRVPGFLRHYLIENHLLRFLGEYPPRGTSYLSLWKFWAVSLAGLLPWSLFLPAVIATSWKQVRTERPLSEGVRPLSEGDWFGLIWARGDLMNLRVKASP